MREYFEQELIALQQRLIQLCEASADALENAFNAFVEMDDEKAKKVIEHDTMINEMEEYINDQVVLLIAKQQPVATDLRKLLSIVKAAGDFERIADYAVNIAKDSMRIKQYHFITSIEPLEYMQALTVKMIREIGEAYMEGNVVKAEQIARLDDEIDTVYGATLESYLKLTTIKSEAISQLTYLSFICKHIERCADHATNIAEHLAYIVKGRHYDFN